MNLVYIVTTNCYIFDKETTTVLGLYEGNISTRTDVELQVKKQSFPQQWKFVYDEQYPKWFKVMNFASGHFLVAFFKIGLMINGMHQDLNNKLSFDSKATMEKLKNRNFYLN